MRRMIEVKEFNTADGKEVVLNNGLTIKDNGDIEVGKNAVVDGNVVLNSADNLVDKDGNKLLAGSGLYKHNIAFKHGTKNNAIFIVNNSDTELTTLTAIKNALSTALCSKVNITHDILSMTGTTTDLTIKYIWYNSDNELSITEVEMSASDNITDTVTVY